MFITKQANPWKCSYRLHLLFAEFEFDKKIPCTIYPDWPNYMNYITTSISLEELKYILNACLLDDSIIITNKDYNKRIINTIRANNNFHVKNKEINIEVYFV